MEKPRRHSIPMGGIGPATAACRSALISTGIFSFFLNLLMLTGPLFMLQVYDRVLTSGSVPTLVALLVLVTFLFVFVGLFEFVRSRLLGRIARRVDEDLSDKAVKSVVEHALRHSRGVGSQPVRDLNGVRQFIAGPGPSTLFDAPWTPVYLGVIFLLHWVLGIFALVGAAILFAVAILNETLTRERLARASGSSHASQSLTEEGRLNAEVLRAMGMEGAFLKRWRKLHEKALDDHLKAGDRSGEITSFSKAMRLFLQSAMLALGAYLAMQQQITPGTMIAASIILSRALQPVEQAIAHWRGVLSARRSFARLQQACSIVPDEPSAMQLPSPSGRLTVEGLSVTAPGGSKEILRDVTFQVEPGEGLGIIGVTGSGKSSLIRALVGLWPAAEGTVRYDNANIDQWTPDALGSHIGYLPQEVQLFSGTIAENIARMAEAPEGELVVDAARQANVHDMILRMPDGYDTMLGEAGAALSAGQRQRIGLARALYGAPKYVVLDEPNANLDADGEAALVEAIRNIKQRGASVVVAAHRPSAISAVDRLLFLKNGQMAAFGLRDEILAAVTQSGPGQKLAAQVGGTSASISMERASS